MSVFIAETDILFPENQRRWGLDKRGGNDQIWRPPEISVTVPVR